MASRTIYTLATLFCSLLTSAQTQAQTAGATYYVAPWGNNQKNGTSPQTPWQTLAYATYQVHAGDTLLIRGGIYSNQAFTVPTGAGTPSNPIRIAAYPGEAPIFTGSANYAVVATINSSAIIDGLHFENLTNVTNAVDIWGSYVTIQNCTFKNVPFQFIRMMGADHVIIQNNYFDGNGQLQNEGLGDAIYAGSATHVLVQDNYDTRAGHYFFDAMALSGGNPSTGIILRDNTVESFWGGGIGHGSAQSLVYENNRLRHIGEGVPYIKASFEIAGMSAIVRHNVITDQAGWYADNALDIVAEDNGGTQDALHNRVYNNVFYKNGYMPIFESQRWERDLADNKVVNNIMYFNETGGSTFYSPAAATYIGIETYHAYPECPTGSPDCSNYIWTQFPNDNYFSNNLILHADAGADQPGVAQVTYTPNTTVAGWTIPGFSDSVMQAQASYAPFVSGNIEQNPQFINADAGDFGISASSPAVSAGTHLAHTTAAGAFTTIVPVDDPYYFTDGLGMIAGDIILIGNNSAVVVTAVNAAAGTLSVNAPITFASGDAVDLADHNGAAPDLGAFPFSASAPALSGISASVINATSAVILWTSSSPSTTQVEYDPISGYGQTSLLDATLNTSHSAMLSGLWPNTTYHYAVISTDASGGRTVSNDGTFTTFSAPGPTISNVTVSGITRTGVTISWSTDTRSTSQAFYSGPDLKYVWNPGYVNTSAAMDSSGVLTHAISLTGLLPNTMYHFSVQSTDGNGNTAHSDDATFITHAVPTPGPVISAINVNAAAGAVGWFAGTPGQSFAPPGMNCCGYSYAQATFSWTTSTPTTQNKVLLIPTVGGGYIQSAELDSSTAVAVAGNPAATIAPSLTVYQLAPNTTYVYMIQSTDANGNTSTSPNYEFTTPSTAAGTGAMSETGVDTSGITGSSVRRVSVGVDGASWALDQSGDVFAYNTQTQSWTQVPGSLAQIAVGSANSVWGINSSGAIYHWNASADTWDWVAGNLSQLAVGADEDVWGLNSQSQIYHFNTGTQSWIQIPGSLQQISVGFDGAVWGINYANQVYRFNPGTRSFEEAPGALTQVAVGADGDVWGLNGQSAYHFNRITQNWDHVSGNFAQLAVGAGNSVWGLDSGGQVYEYNSEAAGWNSIASVPLTQISAGANGAVWGVDGSNKTYQFVGPTQAVQAFHQVPGTVAQIATGTDGSTWALNAAGQIYTYDPAKQSWTWLPGELSQIQVGTGENVWGLNSANQIYRYNPAHQGWDWVQGSLKQIGVGANGDVWGINGAGQIYRFNAANRSWTWSPGSLDHIAVGADGAAWGLNSQGQIYQFDAHIQAWTWIPGAFSQIAVGSQGNVWGINSEGSPYSFNAQSHSFEYVPGASLAQIAVAFDGTVWGVDSANQIFEFDAQTQTWSIAPGSLAQIALGADAVIWGLNANGSVFFYR